MTTSVNPSNSSISAEDEVNIYLKVMKTIPFRVKKSDTIKTLKAKFCEKEGPSEILQELFYAGDHLKDGHTLAACGIKEDSTLHLYLRNADAVRIHVEMLSKQKTLSVEMKIQDTVQHVKSVIQTEEGIKPDCFYLIHAGKVLDDSRTLASLNILNDAVLYLIFDPGVIQVLVETRSKGTVKLEVRPFFTVSDVKSIVGSMMGSSISDQILYYEGNHLEDCKSLAHYEVKEGSVLLISSAITPIFVRTFTGKSVTLNVSLSDTASKVLERVFRKLKLPAQCCPLFLNGKRLEDGRSLASYGIRKDSTLHMGSTVTASP